MNAVKLLKELHLEMSDIIVNVVEVKDKTYESIISRIDVLTSNGTQELYHKLRKIRDTVFQSFLDVYKLRTQEEWKRYDMFDGEYPEIKLLNERKKVLRHEITQLKKFAEGLDTSKVQSQRKKRSVKSDS